MQSPAGSANTGLPRPVRQPVETTKPDLSPTQPLASLGRAQNAVKRRVNAANVGVPSPLNHPVRVTRPDLSPTQPLATSTRDQHVARQPINVQKSNISSTLSQIHASPTSHDRATAHITPQGAHTGGLLRAPALYRHKDGLNKQLIRIESGGEQIHTTQATGTQTTPGCRGMLKVHSPRAEDMPLTRRAGVIERQIIHQFLATWFAHISISLVQKASATIRNTAVGLLSHWQGLTTLSSAGHLLGRLAVSSSKLFLQFRKRLGMI